MSAKNFRKRPVVKTKVFGGRIDVERVRRMSEREIERTSPSELRNLPRDFWDNAQLVAPVLKRAISIRLDPEVLEWFRAHGSGYQSRINAVLRSYVTAMRAKG